jgi:predicted permease
MKRTRQSDDDFAREVEAHLALEADSLKEEGVDPVDAPDAARRRFGNVTSARERFHDATRGRWLEDANRDLRYAWRSLVKAPGIAVIAIVSIAIGVGANAAMFSVADGLILRPLPVPRAADIVTIRATTPGIGLRNPRISHPDFLDLRAAARSFDALVAYRFVIAGMASRPGDLAERKVGFAVSGTFFDALSVRPTLGRGFRADEDVVAGRDAVVVLDDAEWRRRFGGDPDVLNRQIRIGGLNFTIVGVAPRGFTGIDGAVYPAFYIPLAMSSAVQTGGPVDQLASRDFRALVVKARLRPGVTLAQARADVQQVAASLSAAHPETNRDRGLTVQTELASRAEGAGETDARLASMLMALALAVLIVACCNVAGLLLSRAPARARELALRLAIGAGRRRLFRQLLTESLLLALGGGALGLLVGYAAITVFQQLEFPTDVPLKLGFELNRRVLLVGLAAAAASAVLASLVPAWRATRTDLVRTLKEQSADDGTRPRLWGRATLVCAQVALSLALLTVSVFLYRAFHAELGKGPGFRTDRLLLMTFDPGLVRYDESQTSTFYDRLKDAVLATPGVTSAGLSTFVPMKNDTFSREPVAPEGFQLPPGADNVGVLSARVDHDFFRTIDIPIRRGRSFSATDTATTPPVVVVNETFASRYWPGQDAVGRRIRLDSLNRVSAEVIGVVADAKYGWIAEAPLEFIYLPRSQAFEAESTLLVETEGDAAALAAILRDVAQSVDPNVPLYGVRTMSDFYYSRAVHTTNLLVGSIGTMGVMGLVLAMAGLYGLVSFAVGRRTREFGIRMAVGAEPRALLRTVLAHGLRLTVIGIGLGLLVSLAAANALRAAFPAAGTVDTATYLIVVPLLLLVTALAALAPARRASRIDPLVALRSE